MSIKYDKYIPLYAYLSPASIPQIVAHIQDYLVKNPILSVETIAEIIVQSLQEHPELINGEAIPISPDSEQSIKAYIDSLPSIDTYTKAEINLLLTGKQDTLTFDQAPTPGSSNPVTSSGIIAAMSALQTALETAINLKADSASTYTKSQVDTLLTDKANTDDVYSKNTMDAKLLEYATSESVYSKTDINTMKQINKANLAIVSSDGTAPLDIAAGQYVYMDDVMFMATEDILTGARLIPNTNIVINPTGVTNRIGDGLKNAVTQINGLTETVSNQSQQIGYLDTETVIQAPTLNDLKTTLYTLADTIRTSGRKIQLISIFPEFSDSNFYSHASYKGYLNYSGIGQSGLFFSSILTSNMGDSIVISCTDGTWFIHNLQKTTHEQITFTGTATTSDPGNCYIEIHDNFAIINLAGLTDSTTGLHAIATLPITATYRSNVMDISTDKRRIVYIDPATNQLMSTGILGSVYAQLVVLI